MPRRARREEPDTAQYGPRLGESPWPGHWAAGLPGFTGAAYLAHGFDCLAGETGMTDGLSLLLKTCGITIWEAEEASPAQCREWYYQCYMAHAPGQARRLWDIVTPGGGIFSPGSGWDAPRG